MHKCTQCLNSILNDAQRIPRPQDDAERKQRSYIGICSMIGGSSKAERKRVCWRPNRNAETFLIIFVRFLWTNRSGCFKLNWMSGKQTGINAVDQILQKVDLAGIQDERARECIRLLLNLIESLTADLRQADAEILYLELGRA